MYFTEGRTRTRSLQFCFSQCEIIGGDNDGVVVIVASAETFSKLVDILRKIQKVDQAIEEGISQNMSFSMTNYSMKGACKREDVRRHRL
jgi:nitrate reductase NapAB chaperone NapD